jgi:outer membrane protein OmpA-like peptidoglycan-associated protein
VAPAASAPETTPQASSASVQASPDSMDFTTTAATTPPPSQQAADAELALWRRTQSLRESSTLSGSSGLFRTRMAGSGEPGTFRLAFNGSFFSQGGFLCGVDVNPCLDPVTGQRIDGIDQSSRVQTSATLSVTPLKFLEAFASIRNSSYSNSNGRPSVLQIVGDMSLGVKAFTPAVLDKVFTFGGEAELYLLTGTGGVGLSGGSTGFALRALASMDLTRHTNKEDRIPLRAHMNLGYRFDNSAALVGDLESTPPPQGRGEPIQRTERFGLNISRVDAVEIAFGAEYIHDYVRPFAEWTFDIAANRQGYECSRAGAASRGDLCLADGAAFNTMPSRLTFGARAFPWQASGLVVTGAVDIGTGASSVFLEEVTPEAPYNLWLTLGYNIDTRPPEPVVVEVPATGPSQPAAETRRYGIGLVVDEATGAALPGALVLYSDPGATGMVANSEGAFQTADLAPGAYLLKVQAKNYRDAECTVVIPEEVGASGAAPAVEEPGDAPIVDPYAPSASAVLEPKLTEDGNIEVPFTCSLKELPRVGNVIVVVVDGDTGAVVNGGNVKITDPLNRTLELATDAQGSLEFQNVPFGTAELATQAPGYMNGVMPVVIDAREDLKVHVVLNKRPKQLGVKLLAKEVHLPSQIEFVGDTDQVSPGSMAVVEQLATLLREDPKIGPVEIGVHSDGTGPVTAAYQITQARAESLRELLIRLGVNGEKLEAKGHGPDKPLVPGTTDEARDKNSRVEITRK